MGKHPGPPPAAPHICYDVAKRGSECTHPVTRYTRFRFCDGIDRLGDQCLECGSQVGKFYGWKKALEYGLVHEPPPPFDHELQKVGTMRRLQRRHDLYHMGRAEWRAWYAQYLASAEWAERRRKVLERCMFVCEACVSDMATEVHHLTYDRVGYEELDDLMGVCRACHGYFHGRAE